MFYDAPTIISIPIDPPPPGVELLDIDTLFSSSADDDEVMRERRLATWSHMIGRLTLKIRAVSRLLEDPELSDFADDVYGEWLNKACLRLGKYKRSYETLRAN